ncbi:MAG: Asp23/Gls24 family envelope stress response protein [Actinobacteria bacterium]|nr:Asp23/Gls24 family envelope stress response protein [Actinomycetota bacterium]
MSSPDLHIPFSSPGLDGGITVAHQVIAKLAGKAARATYGVVAMQESPVRKLARFFRGSLTEGVEVDIDGAAANIGLHVIMERGVNLAQVTANLQEQVRYQVAEVGGVPLGQINVRVEDLQD